MGDELATAIVDVAKRLGITSASAPFSGPEVLLLLQEIESAARVASRTCDCGQPLTVCSSCAVSEYQGEHTECATCCPRSVKV